MTMKTTKKKKTDPYLEFVVPDEEKTTDGVNEEREDEEGDSDGTKGENEEREGEGEFKFALKPSDGFFFNGNLVLVTPTVEGGRRGFR